MSSATLTTTRWIKACILGWLTGILLILTLSGIFDSIGLEGFQFYIGLGMGGGVGFFQWRVLAKSRKVKVKWVWYSLLGLGTPFLLNDLFGQFYEKPFGNYYLLVSIVLGSVLISLLQFKVLQDSVWNPKRWILISMTGWLAASVMVMAVDYTKYVSSNNWVLFAFNLILILSGGLVLGLVTGRTAVSFTDQNNIPHPQ